MRDYIVITEDGDPGQIVRALDALNAVRNFQKEHDIVADPGFKFYAVALEDAETFEFDLQVVPLGREG